MGDVLTLTAGGKQYAGWTEIAVSRSIEEIASSFEVAVTEGWLPNAVPLLPFTPAVISISGEPVITGYIDTYRPELSKDAHAVRISGRSNTADLVDCCPNVPAGQFSGYTVAAIARALCAIQGISAEVQTALADVVLPDATIQPCEESFRFLDRLVTIAGVILSDDVNGNLILTTAGSSTSGTALVQGVNIEAMTATITSKDRYQTYVVKGQAGLAAQLGAAGQTAPAAASVQNAQSATATDSTVPRNRTKVWLSNSAAGQAPLNVQANWHLQYAQGKATRADITVTGWRQNDGTLWQVNQMVSVTAPYIGVEDELLVFAVKFQISESGGAQTVLTVAPVSAATPNPSTLRQRKGKGGKGRHGGSGINWQGAGGT